MWNKVNLVTLPDMTDQYKCSVCGFTKKYRGFQRDLECPKCKKKLDKNKPKEIRGSWVHYKQMRNNFCETCGTHEIIVPLEGHPLSKYWIHARNDGCKLMCCPKGCLED